MSRNQVSIKKEDLLLLVTVIDPEAFRYVNVKNTVLRHEERSLLLVPILCVDGNDPATNMNVFINHFVQR